MAPRPDQPIARFCIGFALAALAAIMLAFLSLCVSFCVYSLNSFSVISTLRVILFLFYFFLFNETKYKGTNETTKKTRRRRHFCLEFVVVLVERGDFLLETLAFADLEDGVVKLAGLVELSVHERPVVEDHLGEGLRRVIEK